MATHLNREKRILAYLELKNTGAGFEGTYLRKSSSLSSPPPRNWSPRGWGVCGNPEQRGEGDSVRRGARNPGRRSPRPAELRAAFTPSLRPQQPRAPGKAAATRLRTPHACAEPAPARTPRWDRSPRLRRVGARPLASGGGLSVGSPSSDRAHWLGGGAWTGPAADWAAREQVGRRGPIARLAAARVGKACCRELGSRCFSAMASEEPVEVVTCTAPVNIAVIKYCEWRASGGGMWGPCGRGN